MSQALPKAFWEQLPQKTDAELYQMLLEPAGYLPEALAAAQEELRKRHLDPAKRLQGAINAVESRRIANSIDAQDSQKRRLSHYVYHALLILGIPVFLLLRELILKLLSR